LGGSSLIKSGILMIAILGLALANSENSDHIHKSKLSQATQHDQIDAKNSGDEEVELFL
jgi:hypothetical protein